MKEYLKKLPLSFSKALRTRLNMIKAKSNYKDSNRNEICDSCHIKSETTEYLINCWKSNYLSGVNLEEKMIISNSLEELKQMAVGVIALDSYKIDI